MDMMLVLGILALIYCISLFLMCVYRFKINTKLWNTVFIIADFVAFSCWTYASYQRGSLGGGWLTLDNISPLMFTMILLTPFMKDRFKDYVFSAIAFLNVGMFVALFISPEHSYIFSFNKEATLMYTAEAICHMLCSLYGIYLILSNQVKPDFGHWLKSAAFLYSVITFSVVLNFVYHRSHFGMDPYGGASIYMIDIFGSFWATIVAYYFGIAVVLTLGMQIAYFVDKATALVHHHEYNDVVEQNDTDPTSNDGVNNDESVNKSEDDTSIEAEPATE